MKNVALLSFFFDPVSLRAVSHPPAKRLLSLIHSFVSNPSTDGRGL